MATLTYKFDLLLERRASTPVEPTWRPQPVQPMHDRDTFKRQHLDKERFDIPAQDGKHMAGDIYVHKLIPKPYMFVDHLEGKSLKQIQDYKDNVTALEYVNVDFMDQLAHLRDVTEDIVMCTWESNLIFDLVEKGHITWSDTQMIHNYRMRTTVRDVNDPGPAQSDNVNKEVPCPAVQHGHVYSGRNEKAPSYRVCEVHAYMLILPDSGPRYPRQRHM